MENQPNQDQGKSTYQEPTSPGDDVSAEELAAQLDRRRREFQSTPAFAELVAKAASKALAAPVLTAEEIAARQAESVKRESERKARELDWRRGDHWARLVRERGTRYEPCRLKNYVAETDAQKAVLDEIKEYATNMVERVGEGVNVLLIGPPGTGKDHLLMALAHAAIGNDRYPEWRNGTSLWVEFRTAIGEGSNEQEVIHKLTRPDVLMISDPVPPRGPLTDYQAGMLFDVIDARYSHYKPTWITLNCASRKEAEERIGSQVIDRLSHRALVLRCNWPSYRQGDKPAPSLTP